MVRGKKLIIIKDVIADECSEIDLPPNALYLSI